MSLLTEQANNGQQANFKRDLSKIFLWGNRYESVNYTNGTGSEKTLPAGLVMGRISASGLLLPLQSDAVDGSQLPVGVLAADYTVANGATQEVSICVAGDVEESKLIFENGTDTLATVVAARRLRDRLAADTLGIKLVVSDELTDFDNE